MNPNERIKRCGLCDEVKLVSEFPMTNEKYLFHKDGFSAICYDCLIEQVNIHDLDDVNKMCQYLDIGFDPNRWIKLNKEYSDKPRAVFENYINESRQKLFDKSQWGEQNLQWEKVRELGMVLENMRELQDDLFIYLQNKWGSYESFNVHDYLKMESYEKHTLNYYNFRDEARRDLVRKMALVSVLIDKKMTENDTKEMTALMSSYQSLIRESGIQNTVSNDTETITSLSELTMYLEKEGWLLDYTVSEDRDIVDATITNMQRYVKRLFQDSSETLQTQYDSELINKDSGTELNEEELEMMLDSEKDDFELDEEDMLSEEELINMFKEIDKEYATKKVR